MISNSKFSLIIIGNMVVFSNSIGDITAVDIETGLINWQLPTQSSSITPMKVIILKFQN